MTELISKLEMDKVVIFVFLMIIIVSFIRYLKKGDDSAKLLQKLIGGLGVFTVAILSNNGWVYSTSIFIGGLIIASEEFMMFIAAVMKSTGDKVADTVKALKYQKASEAEVDLKAKKEEKEIEIKVFDNISVKEESVAALKTATTVEHTEEPKLREGSNEKVNERVKRIKRVEELIQPFLIERFGKAYEPHIKLLSGEKSLILDGIIKRGEKIKGVVEIKYISPNSFPNLKYLIIRFREKLLKLSFKKRLWMVVVSDNMTITGASKMAEENRGLAILWFFSVNGDKVEPLLFD